MSESAPGTMDTVTKQDIYIKASPEAVYDAIATGEAVNVWFTRHSRWEDRADSPMVWGWEDWGPDHVTSNVPGRVITADRPHRFAFVWGETQPSTVEISIEPAGAGSVVRVRQHGYEDSAEGRDLLVSCSAGWGQAMTMLKYFLEHGIIYETLGSGSDA
ncbi:MAG: SRPBCC domain-containing protein [Anaerolineae bacterium]|jgi:uncharacterized protein YndB with AHSA1/START domain